MTSLGAPVKNGPEVMALLNALQLPEQVPIWKMKAHGEIIDRQVKEAWGISPEGRHDVVPGQWLVLKQYVTDTLGLKQEGPYHVLLITRSAVKVQGK
jgi:hypothetical protein